MVIQDVSNRTQNFPSRIFCEIEVFFCQVAIGEVAFQPGDAPHRQAKKRGGLCPRTSHQFGTGAANIDNQAPVFAAGRMGNALINQTGFFFTADYLHRTAENFPGLG